MYSPRLPTLMFACLFPALVVAAQATSGAPAPEGGVPTPPEPEWVPPSPPQSPQSQEGETGNCRHRTSHPIVSYRVSPACAITDVKAIGNYTYGAHSIEEKVRGFSTSGQIRRFEGGRFKYEREITIQLHRAVRSTSQLICHMDMMGKRVIDAKIVTVKSGTGPVKSRTGETPLDIIDGKLPDLGVYTYGADVPYPEEDCSEVP